MDHIFRAISILPLAFNVPVIINGLIFGKVHRPPIEYNELVAQYLSKLEEGAKATSIFIPGEIPCSYRIGLAEKLLKKVSNINAAIDSISEKNLDHFMLPHPILGKITYREMLYFTIYHVSHHYAMVKRAVAEKSK